MVNALFQTVSLPNNTEVTVRQKVEHITVQKKKRMPSERCTSDVHYHCVVDSKLVTKETNVNQHTAECSYFCDLCKKSYQSQSYLQVHKCSHNREYC